LEFSQAGSSGPWTVIADSLPNNGRYQWRVPSSVNSDNCFIRYTAFVIGGSSAAGINPNPFIVGDLVGIGNYNEIPKQFKLEQNYPNPFNPITNFKFQIPNAGFVKLVIYDVTGREVESLINQQLNPGTYEIQWNALNYPSGVYFYHLIVSGGNLKVFTDAKRMVLAK
jgi:hypothetical protein